MTGFDNFHIKKKNLNSIIIYPNIGVRPLVRDGHDITDNVWGLLIILNVTQIRNVLTRSPFSWWGSEQLHGVAESWKYH